MLKKENTLDIVLIDFGGVGKIDDVIMAQN